MVVFNLAFIYLQKDSICPILSCKKSTTLGPCMKGSGLKIRLKIKHQSWSLKCYVEKLTFRDM